MNRPSLLWDQGTCSKKFVPSQNITITCRVLISEIARIQIQSNHGMNMSVIQVSFIRVFCSRKEFTNKCVWLFKMRKIIKCKDMFVILINIQIYSFFLFIWMWSYEINLLGPLWMSCYILSLSDFHDFFLETSIHSFMFVLAIVCIWTHTSNLTELIALP